MGGWGRIDGFIAQLETYKLDAMQAYKPLSEHLQKLKVRYVEPL
ncbi:MAG TPA: hypothetical protein V6D28_22405 [Leptolyngbyaceae cyanobacterium]